jgi:putative cardiolipin synthase
VGKVGDASATLAPKFAATRADPDALAYVDAVRTTGVVRDLLAGRIAFEWTTATVRSDDPAKTLASDAGNDVLLFPELVRAMGRPERSFDLVSPYFVPGEEGTAALVALARRGVKVRILTNSLASSDEGVVHAGYAKRRLDLLRAGVSLYELKPTATEAVRKDGDALGSSSSAGLHAKTFAVDRERIFVGSFNFDQRSAHLNTEMGMVIASPALAEGLADVFDTTAGAIAYEVRIAPGGRSLEWIERTPSGERVHATEPGTTWSQRAKVEWLSLLPIEWLL